MRRRFVALSLVAGAIVAALLVPTAADGQEFVPGELIVRFAPGVDPAARAAALQQEGATLVRELDLPGVVLVRLPRGASVTEAAEAFARRPDVLYAEPNYLHRLEALPNDPRFGGMWGLNQSNDADIDAPQAWDVTTGSPSVVVAVVDSGVAHDHPDLAPNIWTNPGEIAGNGIDDDGNGLVDDVHGWDFVQNAAIPLDYFGHGTHVAATIGARGNNGKGVTGVNWQVSIMPLRAVDANGSGTTIAIVNAFAYACAKGAHIVNGSFGSSVMSAAIREAVLACPNVLFVFAAGNEAKDLDGSGTANDTFPCELHLPPTSAANVLCVAATAQDDTLASFSNHGSTAVHLAAPGRGILSARPGYEVLPGFPDGFEGTSEEFDSRWGDRIANPGDQLWDRTTDVKKTGSFSLTDSPSGHYANNSETSIRRLEALNLAGKIGCRVDYDFRLDTQGGPDRFQVRVGTTTQATTILFPGWTGSTSGGFFQFSSDLSAFDGQPMVFLRFGLVSDSSVTADGVYVDDVVVKCLQPNGEDYIARDGTSMATPHVAGVAALLLAQDPTRSVAAVKTALLSSVDPLESLAGKTITGGRLNACKALGRTAAECDTAVFPPAPLLLALGPRSDGWLEVLQGASPLAHEAWFQLPWPTYTSVNGEIRPALCDLDGDGQAELVLGLGPGSEGWLEVRDDAATGYAHLAWLQVPWPAYTSVNGETFPACGDLDGDGKAELVLGLGEGSQGWVQVRDDATTGYAHLTWLQLPWPAYNNANGTLHPALGNLDADPQAELVLGLGPYSTGGWLEIRDDVSTGYAHLAWVEVPWPAYTSTNGETRPAICDLAGTGRGALVLGLGPGSQGWVHLRGDATTGFAPLAGTPNPGGWLQLPWPAYTSANGETFPACGDLDGDGKAELVLGLGPYGEGGWLEIRDDLATGLAHSAWTRLNWPAYNARNGQTWPAVGR